MKDKIWLDTKLSDFIANTLTLGLAPILEFKDAESPAQLIEDRQIPIMEKTPAQFLQKEIAFFKSFQYKIETRTGIYIDEERKEEQEAHLQKLHADLGKKIIELEQAVEILNSAPPALK